MSMGFLRKLRDAGKKILHGVAKVAPHAVRAVAKVAPIVGGPVGAVAGAALDRVGKLLK